VCRIVLRVKCFPPAACVGSTLRSYCSAGMNCRQSSNKQLIDRKKDYGDMQSILLDGILKNAKIIS